MSDSRPSSAAALRVSAEIAAGDIAFIEKTAKKYPFLIRKNWGGLVLWLKNRFKKVIERGGGCYGVPAFAPKNPTTLLLHGRRPFGGSIHSKTLAKKWRGPGGRQMVGIPDRFPFLRAFGESLQTSEDRRFSRKERAFFRRIPRLRYDPLKNPNYTRPARPFVAAFADANYPPMIEELRRRLVRDTRSAAAIQKAKSQAEAAARKSAARAAARAARRR